MTMTNRKSGPPAPMPDSVFESRLFNETNARAIKKNACRTYEFTHAPMGPHPSSLMLIRIHTRMAAKPEAARWSWRPRR